MTTARRRVVVSGLGVFAPIGANLSEFAANLFAGVSGARPLSFARANGQTYTYSACFIPDYRPEDHLDPKKLGFYDRFTQFALIAARQAWADAALTMTPDLAPRCAVILGTGAGGQNTLEDSYDRLTGGVSGGGGGRVHPFTIPRLMANAGTSQVSMDIGAQGPAYTIASACASATHAIGVAAQMVRDGVVDVAVTGGSEACLTFGTLRGWEALRVMSPDVCRPFSRDRQGMMMGEGGGALVLETYESAKARGAKIYAEIAGFGMSADAKDLTTPDAGGMARAIAGALRDADLTVDEVDHINAHGTGTRANDTTESAALRQVFGPALDRVAVTANKSMFGHLLGAAGALETVATVLSLRDQRVPPTINYLGADPDCPLDLVTEGARATRIRAALKNSFAFGGLNAVLALRCGIS